MENQVNNNMEDAGFKSDVLKNMKKENVFQTPDHYFEKLPSGISDKIHSGAQKSTGFNWNPVRILGYSTLAVLIAVAGWFYFSDPANEKTTPVVLSYDDLYKSGMVSEMDEIMLVEEYVTQETPDVSGSPNEAGDNLEGYKDYLMENNTDITLIINEL